MTSAALPCFPGKFLPGFVAFVTIGFSESPSVSRLTCEGKSVSMEQAEEILKSGRRSCPADLLGCYKTDFTLTLAAGDTYKGRYDLTRDATGLAEHVFDHAFFLAFKAPDHVLAWGEQTADKVRAECRAWLTAAFGV